MRKFVFLLTAVVLSLISYAQERQTRIIQVNDKQQTEQTRDWVTVGDFTVEDINGNTHHLQEYLDAGKFVVIDFSATWCGPCWTLHQSHVFDNLYSTYGPDGTDELVVLWIETDPSTTVENIQGSGNTQGDWTVGGTWPIPIINDGSPASAFPAFSGVPTVFGVCPTGVCGDVTTEAWDNAEAVWDALQANCPTLTDPPIAKFEASVQGFVNIDLTFTDASISGAPITAREWTFENGTPATSTDETVVVQWDTPGTYEVSLTVTNENGSDTETKNITISDVTSDDFHVTFEECVDFATDMLPYNWTTNDVDGDNTYSAQNFDFPGEGEPSAFKVFNLTDEGLAPYQGDNYVVSIASTGTNDNWLISPKFTVGENTNFSFYAKSLTHQYGAERIKIGISTTDNEPDSFTFISDGEYIEVPTDYTQYSYDLSEYNGQEIYVAIQCVSHDAWMLLVDEIEITGVSTNIENKNAINFNIYPNPANNIVNISNAENANIQIMNQLGQLVVSRNNISINETFDMSKFTAGAYIINIQINNKVYNKHFILIK